jgi:hypothetical protein
MRELKILFDESHPFELDKIKPLGNVVGLYFIFTKDTEIQYPFKKSRLLYIGMSERSTNSISKRLSGHFDGTSKNLGLLNYRKVDQLLFTFISFEMLRGFWEHRIEDLESYFILDFVDKYGVYPICNNKSGSEVRRKILTAEFKIDWNYFGKSHE